MIFARPYVTGWNPITIMIIKIHDCNKTFPRHIESSLRLHTSLTRPVCNLWPTHIHPFWSIYESGLNRYVPCDIILTSLKSIYTGYFDQLYRIATKNLYLSLKIIEYIFYKIVHSSKYLEETRALVIWKIVYCFMNYESTYKILPLKVRFISKRLSVFFLFIFT